MQEDGGFRHTAGPHLTRAVGDELVVLDVTSKVAHALSAEAAAVWQACDGASDAGAIACSTEIEPGRVAELLAQLAELDLIAGGSSPATHTRRRALGKMVGAGVGLGLGIPAITSLVLPTAAEAFLSFGPPPGETVSVPTTTPVIPVGSTQPPGVTKATQHKRHKHKRKQHHAAKHATHPHKRAVPTGGTTTPGSGTTAPEQIVTFRGNNLPFAG